jgi:hypothetical protein
MNRLLKHISLIQFQAVIIEERDTTVSRFLL